MAAEYRAPSERAKGGPQRFGTRRTISVTANRLEGAIMPFRTGGPVRRAFTLLELALSLTIVAVLTGVALPLFHHVRDRAAVLGATTLLTSALADARHLAVRWQRRTAVRVDTSLGHVVVHALADTLVRAPLQQIFGVTIAATRDSIAFYPTGLGFGAANTRLIVARGSAAETVTVSRAGRVRR